MKKLLAFFILITLSIQQIGIGILPLSATYINTIGIQGDFSIENDSFETFSQSVTLNLDLSGVSEMRFGNTQAARDSASWETYASTKSWTLSSTQGKKTVYGSFKNASNTVVNFQDDILLKDIPTLPYTGGLTLWLDGKDSASITESGGNIRAWDDKSGNNYHALQNTLSKQANLLPNGEIDFNGTSEYFYIENLNYQNISPLDGLLVCGVMKTNFVSSTFNDNWAILDFDRSEWFNFYNKGGDYGFSYTAGGTEDVATTGLTLNDNQWHIACASYDNTLTNDTEISINGNIEFSADRRALGSQIGVGKATRYGFVGDGSEAATQDSTRNNIFYDGGIGEIVYYDSPVSSSDKKDIECYLGEKWNIQVAGCPNNFLSPIASVLYMPENTTSGNVIATLENESVPLTITNNGGSSTYTFTSNGTFTFEYEDIFGNTGSTLAKVDWIDPTAPPLVGTGVLNEAPTILSYSGTTSITLAVGSGVTDVADIDAVDTTYNIIGEYGNGSLSGNTWSNIGHAEMCSPVVTVSHRQNVNGEIQRAPRVRSKTGTGFELRVDNYNSSIGSISTKYDYIVMNAGRHSFPGGLEIEAGSQASSVVACNATNNPTPTAVSYSSSFISLPAVLHSIATENDATWTVSSVNGNTGSRISEPGVSSMGVMLQRSFNSCTHDPEDIDYIAIEPGNYTLADGSILDATRSTDSILSISSGGNPINFTQIFSSPPNTVLVSQLGQDGYEGGYAQIHTGGSEVTSTQVFATIDEDGPAANRSHTNEVVTSVAFDKNSGQFWKENTLTYSISGGADAGDFTINSVSGKLDFITGKDPNNYTDTNNDGIYEVEVSVCDSHCNSQCSTQTIFADVSDIISPIISSIAPGSGSLLPGGNHTISISHSDIGVGIDTSGNENINFYRNIAPEAIISATANTTWGGVSGTGGIANGVINTSGSLDYEYHSDTTGAFIEFDFGDIPKIGALKIYNRTSSCDGRLSNGIITLFDESNTLIYTYTLGDTTGQAEIIINFQDLGQIHNVSRIRLESVGADSYINIREIEIFPFEKNIVLQKWNGTQWGNNIANTHVNFSGSTVTGTEAQYPFNDLNFGKYKVEYRVFDLNGNNTSTGSIFYIDEPELSVSSGSIDIGNLSSLSNAFSDTVTVEVKTVGAGFDLLLKQNIDLSYAGETISGWDGVKGYGYQKQPYNGNISGFLSPEIIASETQNINTNGDKNSYSYEIQLGTLIDIEQTAGDYKGSIDIGIELEY